MKYLLDNEDFEILIGKKEADYFIPEKTVIYFTATWCGPCQKIDKNLLNDSLSGINFLICDTDKNDYTAGYCGIRKIPTFMVIYKTKIITIFTSTNTSEIIAKVQQAFPM